MKTVLVIGSGGREHAIVDAIARSSQVGTIYCAPGNAGIAQLAQTVAIADTDCVALRDFALSHHVDLTIVGPEAALAAGVVDMFRAAGLTIFGHTAAATRIESSKQFAKQLMSEADVPTAAYRTFSDYHQALAYVQAGTFPTVLKYDGLAAGKGVVVADSLEQADTALRSMLLDEVYGEGQVVIEQFLTGPEFSFMCFVSGENVYPMPLAQDHKRAYDDDLGPNTGGMGAYTPLPFITDEDRDFALRHILQPIAKVMAHHGLPLSGVLYGGLMKTPQGIQVIEFNARFGDPETEVILPLLRSDAYDLFYAIASGTTPEPLVWDQQAVIGVVLASKGYPGTYTKGATICGVESFPGKVYHMGTRREGERLVTNGGRVLMCLQSAHTLADARQQLYAALTTIQCDNLFCRHDIAHSALKN